jgi:hypothetical protein
MRIFPEKLAQYLEKQHLEGNWGAIVWVAGDEPLLVQETCDIVRAAGLKQGIFRTQGFSR